MANRLYIFSDGVYHSCLLARTNMEQYEFSLTNSPAELQQLQSRLQAVFQTANLRPKVISAINLALGEWIENIIQHAYADGANHEISVQCSLGPADVTVQVTDDGRPFQSM